MQLCLHGKVQASDGVPHEKLLVSETKVEASFCPKHANFDEIRFNIFKLLNNLPSEVCLGGSSCCSAKRAALQNCTTCAAKSILTLLWTLYDLSDAKIGRTIGWHWHIRKHFKSSRTHQRCCKVLFHLVFFCTTTISENLYLVVISLKSCPTPSCKL